jgi:GNAT superfamily N-acetyltransferase
VKIRDVTKADYPALAKMMGEFERYLATLEPGLKKKKPVDVAKALQRLDLLDHGGAGLIAEIGARAVGYLLYFPSASLGSLERTLYMPDFFVRGSHRGKGIGKKLIHALAEKARDRRATSILWTVYDRNPKAMAFYYKLGAHVIRDEMIMVVEVRKSGRGRARSAMVRRSRA